MSLFIKTTKDLLYKQFCVTSKFWNGMFSHNKFMYASLIAAAKQSIIQI